MSARRAACNGSFMRYGKLLRLALLAATAWCLPACSDKQEIFDNQLSTIETWVNNHSSDYNFEQIASGVYRAIISPVDGQGSPRCDRGDSLSLMFEIYQFSSSFSSSTSGLIYTNRRELMPEGVAWDIDSLRIVLGAGSIIGGVEESLIGSAPEDSVVVIMTSSNAYGDHTVQTMQPNTPVAWKVKVGRVIPNRQ